MEGRAGSSNRSGQSSSPRAEPSMAQARKWGHGTQPPGLTNSWHGPDPGLVKGAKPGLGLECRTQFQPGRGREVVRAATGTSPAAMGWDRAGIWPDAGRDSDPDPRVCSRPSHRRSRAQIGPPPPSPLHRRCKTMVVPGHMREALAPDNPIRFPNIPAFSTGSTAGQEKQL